MRADGLLFDKDGTLFDFRKTWEPWAARVIAQLADGDSVMAAKLAQIWGFDLGSGRFEAHSMIVAAEVWEIAEAAQVLFPHKSQDQVLRVLDDLGAEAEGVEVLPLPAFLQDLKAQGLKIGVATNDSESTARAQLGRAGVEALFDFIVGYDSGFGGKPAPGMCTAFAEHVGFAPHRIVMVGDSVHDLEAGRAAGMQVVAVLTGVAERAALAPHADIVLPDIGYLPAWLKG